MAQANLKTIPAEPSGQDAPDMLARITAEKAAEREPLRRALEGVR